MQIQIKQAAIEQAIKDYVAKQGIRLQGRDVEISFTAGRKGGGLSADISISDVADNFPDFGPGDDVQSPAQEKESPLKLIQNSVPAAEEPAFDTDSLISENVPGEDETVSATAATKTTSLFSS